MQIYHNPRCSKSRETLKLIQSHEIEPEVILYLENPPSPKELEAVIKYLDIAPRELLRKKEQVYKDKNIADETLTDKNVIRLMCENPVLIERPIVIKDKKAIVGRPPENVLTLLES